MTWEYGNIMLEDEAIESLDEWSDDKEFCSSIMDREFDYLWDYSKGKIHYIDRIYSSGELDDKARERMANNEAELWFDSFDDVKTWIDKKTRR